MEGSGIEGLTLKDSRTVPVESEQQRTLSGSTEQFIEDMKAYFDYYESRIRISVEGFDPCTDPVVLIRYLEDLFKTSGKVQDIEMEIDPLTKKLTRSSCVVYLRGEGAEQRVPLLDGSVLGGKKLRVTLSPLATDGLSTSVRAARHVAAFQRSRSEAISVTGYDHCLPQDALKSALRKHFAPCCGEVTDISVLGSRALVHLYGLGSVHRALELNGADLGDGFNLTVEAVDN